MCRWLAYSGSPILLAEALDRPSNSLVAQSLHSRLGAEATNGDGFGMGWYDDTEAPGVFRSTEPAWNDYNLHELCDHLRSGHFFAHVRAATGSAVQQTNCHPFRYGTWLFMHNGFINGYAKVRRDMAFAVDPSLFPEIRGTTDSELLFYLALTFGLQDDPPSAIERAIGFVEATGSRLGVPNQFQGTVATTDGQRTWAVRYSTEGKSRSLYYTIAVPQLRELFPEDERTQQLSDEMRIIVSEPFGDIADAWNEVPEATCSIVQGGEDEMRPFTPKPPPLAVAVGGALG